jgi:hypothetical protein
VLAEANAARKHPVAPGRGNLQVECHGPASGGLRVPEVRTVIRPAPRVRAGPPVSGQTLIAKSLSRILPQISI